MGRFQLDEQAELQIQVVTEIIEADLATKQDLEKRSLNVSALQPEIKVVISLLSYIRSSRQYN